MQENSAMLTSFDFMISISSFCLSSYNYTVTPIDKVDTVQDVITFNGFPSSFTESGFDVCNYTYSFTAVPNIADGTGQLIYTVQDPIDFTGT